ncbi:MAG TPA: ribosome-associated translation inhibitor RaiA [Mycobacteriales bacterium]|nr:ribosome-associated translation inhibitor RaiA [Mycobacteriales bacterium]
MDIVVRGRNVEVPEHYRQHVADKLHRAERHDPRIVRVDVELYHERNRRQSNACQRVEITCRTRGPVVRSEACAQDFYAALDTAVSKLESRLRRAADRRRVHHGTRTPRSVAAATGGVEPPGGPPSGSALGTAVLDHPEPDPTVAGGPARTGGGSDTAPDVSPGTPWEDAVPESAGPAGSADRPGQDRGPGRVVREKEHPAKPMSIDQALFEMEMVGHDFYLFSDVDTGRPSVVYRRKGYDYGVIRLAG